MVKKITTSESDENVLSSQKQMSDVSWCLVLTNVIFIPDMKEDRDYDEVAEDTEDEMAKYGKVVRLVVPKPRRAKEGGPEPGVGRIYVKFLDTIGSTVAISWMSGRRFEGRVVEAKYYPEEKFDDEIFE